MLFDYCLFMRTLKRLLTGIFYQLQMFLLKRLSFWKVKFGCAQQEL